MSNGFPNTVVDVTPNRPQVVLGLIPCQNRYYQDLIWPVIRKGVQTMAEASEGEWTEFRAWSELYAGSIQLYVMYVNDTPSEEKPGINQQAFIEKLKTPEKDYAGFFALQLFPSSVHVFVVWVEPEYRKTEIGSMALDFLEEQVRGMGAPFMSAAVVPDLLEPAKKRGYKYMTINVRKKLKK